MRCRICSAVHRPGGWPAVSAECSKWISALGNLFNNTSLPYSKGSHTREIANTTAKGVASSTRPRHPMVEAAGGQQHHSDEELLLQEIGVALMQAGDVAVEDPFPDRALARARFRLRVEQPRDVEILRGRKVRLQLKAKQH